MATEFLNGRKKCLDSSWFRCHETQCDMNLSATNSLLWYLFLLRSMKDFLPSIDKTPHEWTNIQHTAAKVWGKCHPDKMPLPLAGNMWLRISFVSRCCVLLLVFCHQTRTEGTEVGSGEPPGEGRKSWRSSKNNFGHSSSQEGGGLRCAGNFKEKASSKLLPSRAHLPIVNCHVSIFSLDNNFNSQVPNDCCFFC